jgi:hypothetical protein
MVKRLSYNGHTVVIQLLRMLTELSLGKYSGVRKIKAAL